MFASPLPISYSLAAWKTGAQMIGTIFDNVTPLVEVILRWRRKDLVLPWVGASILSV